MRKTAKDTNIQTRPNSCRWKEDIRGRNIYRGTFGGQDRGKILQCLQLKGKWRNNPERDRKLYKFSQTWQGSGKNIIALEYIKYYSKRKSYWIIGDKTL